MIINCHNKLRQLECNFYRIEVRVVTNMSIRHEKKHKTLEIDHICINLLVPSAQKINIENPGNQVKYWGGGLNHPINFAGYLFFQY